MAMLLIFSVIILFVEFSLMRKLPNKKKACHISCGWSKYMGTCQMIGDTKDSRVRVVVNNDFKGFRALSVYSA